MEVGEDADADNAAAAYAAVLSEAFGTRRGELPRFDLVLLGLGVDGFLNKLLLVIAIAFGTINVVGGFLVTDRMLEMFKSKPAPKPELEEGEG